jgi:hypothetical protein
MRGNPPRVVTADPREVQRLDRELAAPHTHYMKELRAAILALEKRISSAEERCPLQKRLEATFNARMLARHRAQITS